MEIGEKQTLTLEISLTKTSVINKLERASLTFQQFKNLLYLCIREYFKNTKDLKPFLSVSFSEKFVEGKENFLERCFKFGDKEAWK
jgi:hypothetical protein